MKPGCDDHRPVLVKSLHNDNMRSNNVPEEPVKTKVLIIGGGPGGATSALFLAQKGIQSTLVEKEQFPRYHIGESLTGECGNCLRLLGFEDEMKDRGYPVKYGVSVYGPGGANPFRVPVMARSPKDELMETSTWQVRRSDFDDLLHSKCRESQHITLVQGKAIEPILDKDTVRGARIRLADGTLQEIESEVLIDASGMATWLCNSGVTSKKDRGSYDKQVAIFSQVKGAIRDTGKLKDETLIFYRSRCHWAWFIPLDEETVSVGVVTPSEYFKSKKESKQNFLERELRELNPELTRRLPEAQLTEETRAISNYSYHIRNFTGKGYLCVGDAHRFIDPVFSFGLYFSVKEAQRAADEIEAYLGGANRDLANPFAEYQRQCEHGQSVIQELIDAFWDHPMAFSFFVHWRYREDFIDLFAGRVYAAEPSPGLMAMRRINRQSHSRPADSTDERKTA